MYNKISLLIPVYGVEKYIERCARSLFGQTYQNIEYISGKINQKRKNDDGATDVQ